MERQQWRRQLERLTKNKRKGNGSKSRKDWEEVSKGGNVKAANGGGIWGPGGVAKCEQSRDRPSDANCAMCLPSAPVKDTGTTRQAPAGAVPLLSLCGAQAALPEEQRQEMGHLLPFEMHCDWCQSMLGSNYADLHQCPIEPNGEQCGAPVCGACNLEKTGCREHGVTGNFDNVEQDSRKRADKIEEIQAGAIGKGPQASLLGERGLWFAVQLGIWSECRRLKREADNLKRQTEAADNADRLQAEQAAQRRTMVQGRDRIESLAERISALEELGMSRFSDWTSSNVPSKTTSSGGSGQRTAGVLQSKRVGKAGKASVKTTPAVV